MTSSGATTRAAVWRARLAIPGARTQLTLILLAAFAWSALSLDTPAGLIHTGGVAALGEIALAFVTPDLSPGFLRTVVSDAWTTLAFAVAGMTVAVIVGVPLGVVASGVLQTSRFKRLGVMAAARAVLAALRAVHEIVWAILLVAAFGVTPAAGVLAIGVPYAGILGRILAERLQDAPGEPLAALRASGASETEVLVYGRVPASAADVVSYAFYRLECAVRAAAVLSFVGLGGLGLRITTALNDLAFERMWTAVFALVLLVVGIDLWSALVRRRLSR
ncbi:MAG: ABC transporter permease subunit [Chloroflexi bacterium]|nr:ABC transporter permease subunit [Chloroflexota bacterium]